MNESYQSGLVALAGGGQTGATKIGSLANGDPKINRFTTVATTADSAMLPPAGAGLTYHVINAGAASMTVYPTVGTDSINGSSNATGFAVANAKSCYFVCAANGVWNTLLSA